LTDNRTATGRRGIRLTLGHPNGGKYARKSPIHYDSTDSSGVNHANDTEKPSKRR
jgi:hypothetical protein